MCFLPCCCYLFNSDTLWLNKKKKISLCGCLNNETTFRICSTVLISQCWNITRQCEHNTVWLLSFSHLYTPVLLFNPYLGERENKLIHSFPKSICSKVNLTYSTEIRTQFADFSFSNAKRYNTRTSIVYISVAKFVENSLKYQRLWNCMKNSVHSSNICRCNFVMMSITT